MELVVQKIILKKIVIQKMKIKYIKAILFFTKDNFEEASGSENED